MKFKMLKTNSISQFVEYLSEKKKILNATVGSFLLLANICAFAYEAVVGDYDLKRNPNTQIGVPTNESNAPEIIISRKQYVISWNKERKVANWTMWSLRNKDLGKTPRDRNFHIDKDLERAVGKDYVVTPKDYQGSCFDRGHQVGAADRNSSFNDETETFMMSNIIPQTAFLNRGPWERLEQYERSLVKEKNKDLYIIVGTIFDEDYGAIGPYNDIVVPSKNYKIILVKNSKNGKIEQTIAVIMPNITSAGTPPTDQETLCSDFGNNSKGGGQGNGSNGGKSKNKKKISTDWKQYMSSVSEIENLSGFNFPMLHR